MNYVICLKSLIIQVKRVICEGWLQLLLLKQLYISEKLMLSDARVLVRHNELLYTTRHLISPTDSVTSSYHKQPDN